MKKLFILMILCCFIVSCKIDLYSNLTEKEINEMMDLLDENGIKSEKTHGEEKSWTIRVESKDFGNAIEILNAWGYPRPKYDNLGKIFEKSGFVSSPLEEKSRLNYAISEQISEAISNIDGVISTKVILVLPNDDSLDDNKVSQSSASVMIKYRSNINIEQYTAKIKNLVSKSVPGLIYDNISLALFPTNIELKLENKDNDTLNILGIKILNDSLINLILLLSTIFIVIFIETSFILYKFWYQKRPEKIKDE